MISGQRPPPVVPIENARIAARHISPSLIAAFMSAESLKASGWMYRNVAISFGCP